MKNLCRLTVLFLGLILFTSTTALAHCEIPCGIYDDEMRIKLIAEHVTTIEKSMAQIQELEKATPHNSNQLIRWVTNKEDHANQLQEIVTQYFMTQRIKPDAEKYQEKLVLLHKMLLASMKAKQTTDMQYIAELRQLLADFEKLYTHAH